MIAIKQNNFSLVRRLTLLTVKNLTMRQVDFNNGDGNVQNVGTAPAAIRERMVDP